MGGEAVPHRRETCGNHLGRVGRPPPISIGIGRVSTLEPGHSIFDIGLIRPNKGYMQTDELEASKLFGAFARLDSRGSSTRGGWKRMGWVYLNLSGNCFIIPSESASAIMLMWSNTLSNAETEPA